MWDTIEYFGRFQNLLATKGKTPIAVKLSPRILMVYHPLANLKRYMALLRWL